MSRQVCPLSGYCLHMNEHSVAFHGSAVYEIRFSRFWGFLEGVCVCEYSEPYFTVWVMWWGDVLAPFRQRIFYVSKRVRRLFPQMCFPANNKSCSELTVDFVGWFPAGFSVFDYRLLEFEYSPNVDEVSKTFILISAPSRYMSWKTVYHVCCWILQQVCSNWSFFPVPSGLPTLHGVLSFIVSCGSVTVTSGYCLSFCRFCNMLSTLIVWIYIYREKRLEI